MAAEKNRKRSVESLKVSVSGKNKYLDKLMSDSHFRLLVITAFGGGWNFIYALYHLILAVVLHSYWFLTMGVYYLSVCGMRAAALRLNHKIGDSMAGKKALKRNAFLTFALAIIFSGVVCLTIIQNKNSVYHTIIAISMATYTFYCVISAIKNLIHLRKNRTVQKILLRNCSMVYALGSLFGLERMMLGTFGGESAGFVQMMEAASGAGFFIIIVLFGINLLMLAAKK